LAGLVEALQGIGLSLNEAKAYKCLLRLGRANGYEVSKQSGIKRSVIYGVLERLVEKGYVLKVDSDPVLYAPLPPSQLLLRCRAEWQTSFDRLETELARIESGIGEDCYILGISGYENTIHRARELVRGAEHEVALSVWGSDSVPLRGELEDAAARGVKVVIFSHSRVPFRVGIVHEYGLDEDIVRKIWPHRRLVVVADGRTVLIGDIRDDSNLGILTTNPLIVQLVVEQLTLDIFHLSQLVASVGDLSRCIHSADDYMRVVTDYHRRLGLSAENIPVQVRR